MFSRRILFHTPPTRIRTQQSEQADSSGNIAKPAKPQEVLDEAPTGEQPNIDQEAIVEVLRQINYEINELETRRKASLNELQMVALELAIALAEKIVHQKIEQGEFGFENILLESIQRLDQPAKVTVWSNDQDVALIRNAINDSAVAADLHIEFKSDSRLNRGDCRIETGETGLISTIDWQMDQLRKALLEGLSDAQTERRQTEAPHSGVRRFPDRRETA